MVLKELISQSYKVYKIILSIFLHLPIFIILLVHLFSSMSLAYFLGNNNPKNPIIKYFAKKIQIQLLYIARFIYLNSKYL